jgi:hypothetical protein
MENGTLIPLLLTFGGMVIAAVLLAVLFVPKFHLAIVRAPPDRALAYLTYKLRVAQHRVTEEEGSLTVRIGPTSAVRISARASDGGSRVLYQAYATPAGWGTLMTLIILSAAVPVVTGILAIVGVLYVFFRDRAFARSRVAPLVPADGNLPEPPGPEDVSAILVTALAEGHRAAIEAYEAERASFWDYQGIVILCAIILWAVLFMAAFLLNKSDDFAESLSVSVGLATLAAVLFAALTGGLLWRRFRPRFLRHRAWAERLRRAMEREAARETLEGAELSVFELLSEASQEFPVWREAVRRAGLSLDPAAGILVLAMAVWAISLVLGAIFFAMGGDVFPALALGFAGSGLGAALYLFHQRWKRKREEKQSQEVAAWNRRLEAVQTQMERFLREL